MRLRRVRAKIRKSAYRTYVRTLRAMREEVLVLGDSHAKVFKDKILRRAFRHHVFNVVAVSGATVSGLENPNSKTQAWPKFERAVGGSTARTVVVLLGEVDTGFVIWYRAQKYGTGVDQDLARAVEKYQNMLHFLKADHTVICISAPLPTIGDDQDWGSVANARRSVRTTQSDRTRLTVEFNRRMRQFCAENSIAYVDLDQYSLGDDGLVDQRLLNRRITNHHYDRSEYARLIAGALAAHMG